MKRYLELNNELMRKKDGFFQLEKDLEAVEDFQREVNSKMKKFDNHILRLKWLIENDFYIDFLKVYKEEEVLNLIEIIYSHQFKFKSYMAISKFYQSYALKTNDKKEYLETYEDRIVCVALYLGQGNIDKAIELGISMIEQRYQPATPTFLNAGRSRGGKMISCFLLSMDDSLNSINYVLNTCAQLSKVGGGVAVDVTRLRGRNETIKGVENASSGVIPVLKLLEDTFAYVNQLGQRNGAGVAYLNIFHWDIEEFLDTKKINASEKSRLQTLSIGTIIPNKFMELAQKGNEYYVFAPHTVYQATGKHLDEIDLNEEYESLVNNPKIKKRLLNPRKILVNISKMQFESGYPYIMFSDNANKDHALKELGRVKMSNLCTEIFQLQETSIINDYGVEDMIKRDVCCNLGSLNIANVMDSKLIKESVYSAIDALTVVSDETFIENAPGVNKANKELHAIGLGAMNLHGYLTKSYIPYESEDAKEFASQFFMMVNYYSLKRSLEIAKERKETFLDFKKSEYANGKYFNKYLQNDYTAKSQKVAKLFEGMEVPTKEDWATLKEEVAKHGLYHAYRLAIAPTQSIGYVQNATPSVTPVVDLIERRTYGDSTTYYPMPYLSPYNVLLYKSAFNMDMFKMIDLIAVMQEHVDQGISTTLYVSSDTTTKELTRYYIYAYKKGLKALYYTRTKNLAFEECLVCSV
ncbi:class 1b ribonucleoside-diphosphate reductase subunit alpha [Clostridium disporicum]|uniref:class 1b ribonucleoside-diphosphate reductase subunit alpha n=1 Tax=Clostridium disporicum TaxID=84024 RepID=UPI0034A1EFF3